MKTIFSLNAFALLAFVFISSGLKSQTIDLSTQPKANQPDVHINVNRELDKDGNVVRYDSTYSWSWSGDGSQVMQDGIVKDSITNNIFRQFGFNGFSDEPFFNSFGFANDSLSDQIFNNPSIDSMQKQMLEMMQRQQEMINEMIKRQQVPSVTPDNKNNQKTIPEKKTSGNGIDI